MSSPGPAAPAHRRPSLLAKVNSRAAIRANRKVRSVLEGEYGSVHKGRSMDFEDLREYVHGDNIKDIDWKATARSANPLVKRFVAIRQHAVLLVVDTGRSMAALADPDNTKRDVAVMTAGIVGQLAARHGDLVGLVAGPAPGTRHGVVHLPLGKSKAHLERVLRAIYDQIDADGPRSDLDAVFDYVISNVHRRMITLVICDDIELTEARLSLLRRMHAQHEVMVCCITDVPLSELVDGDVRLQGSGAGLPAFFRGNGQLAMDLRAAAAARAKHTTRQLQRLGIPCVRMHGEASVMTSVIELLERQRRARR